MPGFAPCAKAPSGPILSKMPCKALGLSVATNEFRSLTAYGGAASVNSGQTRRRAHVMRLMKAILKQRAVRERKDLNRSRTQGTRKSRETYSR